MRKVMIFMLSVVMLCSSCVSVFAAAIPLETGGVITPKYLNVGTLTCTLSFSGSTANASVKVEPKGGTTIDYVSVSAKLMKVGSSTPVKSWSEKVYVNSMGEFKFNGSTSVSARGTYYLSTTVKTYQNGKLADTISKESSQVVY